MASKTETSKSTGGANGSYLFAGFAVLGIVVIFVTKLSNLPVWALPIPPLILMGLYAAIVYRVPQFELPPDQIGDNSYYLGFLYTLTSLIAALVRNINSPEAIIGDFGIAIITTMAGVGMRVFFSQLSFTPDQAERLVSKELNTATREMLQSMDAATKGFSSYNDRNQKLIEDGFDKISQEFAKNSDSLQRDLHATHKTAMEMLSQTGQSTTRALQEMDGPLRDIVNNAKRASSSMNEVHSAIDALVEEMDIMSNRLSEVRMPDDVLSDALKPAITQLEKSNQGNSAQSVPLWFLLWASFALFIQTAVLLGFAIYLIRTL